MILRGEKTCTWRLFDDKALKVGDTITFVNSETGKSFGTATITSLSTRTFSTLAEEDRSGHEGFASKREMYEAYRSYYPDENVGPGTQLKVLHFNFKEQ